jgi:tRNA/rRNA methyltransferase
MANMGLCDLWIVSPRCDHLSHEARQRSTRGEAILESARVAGALADALDGLCFSAAASCRGGLYREQIEVPPDRMAALAAERAAGGAFGLVFGPEDSGLRSDEVLSCDIVVRIPSSPEYPSLNLSHAMTVCAYELYKVASGGAESREFLGAGLPEPANAPTMNQLMTKLEAALVRIGYLRAEHPEHLLFPIRAILSRARLSQREAQILIGLAQQIQEYANRHEPPA